MFKRRSTIAPRLAALAFAAACVNFAACAYNGDEESAPSDETIAAAPLELGEGSGGASNGLPTGPGTDTIPCIFIKETSLSGDVQDAHIRSAIPGLNLGSLDTIAVGSGDMGTTEALLQFVIQPNALPAGAIVHHAEIILRGVEAKDAGTLDVHSILQFWKESTVTYANQPLVSASALKTVPYSGQDNVNFDVTSLVIGWLNDPAHNFGIMLRPSGSEQFFSASSSESTLSPQLTICFTLDPCRNAVEGTPCGTPETCTEGTCRQGKCDGSPMPAGTVCRSAAGTCDWAEVCDGATMKCPDQVLAPRNTECREVQGECDVLDVCNGATSHCPNGFKPASTECRAATGICDAAESCTGYGAHCPDDGFLAEKTLCRAADGPCDRDDMCNGFTKDCFDEVWSGANYCRWTTGECDVTDMCDGTNKACPADAKQPNGTSCEGTNMCQDGNCVPPPPPPPVCGHHGTPCCADNTCPHWENASQPLTCNVTSNGCEQCGGAINQQCCPFPINSGSGCDPQKGLVCKELGAGSGVFSCQLD
jgi:hypothetical protein